MSAFDGDPEVRPSGGPTWPTSSEPIPEDGLERYAEGMPSL
jgi:hypothetical protein